MQRALIDNFLRRAVPCAAIAASACSSVEVIGREHATSCELADYDLSDASWRPRTVTVATFWAADREEGEALNVLRERLDDLTAELLGVRRDDREDQQLRALEDVASGLVPWDVYQVNGGSDVLQFVAETPSDNTGLCPLDRLAARDGYDWYGRFYPAAIEPSTCNGSLYALPLGIHRLNTLLFNRQRLGEIAEELGAADSVEAEARLRELSSAEFIELVERIGELGDAEFEGMRPVPLAIGTTDDWPILILAFENLLASYDRPSLYEQLWYGQGSADLEPALERLAADLERLGAVSPKSFPVPPADQCMEDVASWQCAVARVAYGHAVFTVMGDWALTQVAPAMRHQVGVVPFPGTSELFVYTPDSFAVPRRRKTRGAEAHLWLAEVIDDLPTQLRFAMKKHAIPALELSPDELSEAWEALPDAETRQVPEETEAYLRQSHERFYTCRSSADCQLLLAVSGLGPPPGRDACFDEMGLVFQRIAGLVDDPITCLGEEEEEPSPKAIMKATLMRIAEQGFVPACR